MQPRNLSLLIALFLIIAPIVQTLGQCAVMGGKTAGEMPMADSSFCQTTNASFYDANTPHGKVFGEKRCFLGSLCDSHFYAIDINPGQTKPLFDVSLSPIPSVQFAVLNQIIIPEIKPPIALA